jgi:hypothetical protein
VHYIILSLCIQTDVIYFKSRTVISVNNIRVDETHALSTDTTIDVLFYPNKMDLATFTYTFRAIDEISGESQRLIDVMSLN